MNDVAVTYQQNSQVENLLSTYEFVEHGDERFFTPAYVCWGERIRTSDWLIQNQLPYRLATPHRDVNEVYRSAKTDRATGRGLN